MPYHQQTPVIWQEYPLPALGSIGHGATFRLGTTPNVNWQGPESIILSVALGTTKTSYISMCRAEMSESTEEEEGTNDGEWSIPPEPYETSVSSIWETVAAGGGIHNTAIADMHNTNVAIGQTMIAGPNTGELGTAIAESGNIQATSIAGIGDTMGTAFAPGSGTGPTSIGYGPGPGEGGIGGIGDAVGTVGTVFGGREPGASAGRIGGVIGDVGDMLANSDRECNSLSFLNSSTSSFGNIDWDLQYSFCWLVQNEWVTIVRNLARWASVLGMLYMVYRYYQWRTEALSQ